MVLAHGLGAVKEMGLEPYAEAFANAGYVVLVFDYRHFGESGGEPRQLLDIHRQLQDWKAALQKVRSLSSVDPDKVGVFGSSFGGGHVIVTAAEDNRVAVAIAQCPFTDGLASATTLGARGFISVSALAITDRIGSLLGSRPVMVPLAGKPGSTALMNSTDALSGYQALLPETLAHENQVAARIGLQILRHKPGSLAKKIQCPILFLVCDKDTVAPPGPTLRHAQKAPKAEVIRYPIGHFDIYKGSALEKTLSDQLAFLAKHLPVGPS
jgi:pimeloyl-ACP methyl ester carboxylesterase